MGCDLKKVWSMCNLQVNVLGSFNVIRRGAEVMMAADKEEDGQR